jgi:hypothetical protein
MRTSSRSMKYRIVPGSTASTVDDECDHPQDRIRVREARQAPHQGGHVVGAIHHQPQERELQEDQQVALQAEKGTEEAARAEQDRDRHRVPRAARHRAADPVDQIADGNHQKKRKEDARPMDGDSQEARKPEQGGVSRGRVPPDPLAGGIEDGPASTREVVGVYLVFEGQRTVSFVPVWQQERRRKAPLALLCFSEVSRPLRRRSVLGPPAAGLRRQHL